jgi:hypothetical protein
MRSESLHFINKIKLKKYYEEKKNSFFFNVLLPHTIQHFLHDDYEVHHVVFYRSILELLCVIFRCMNTCLNKDGLFLKHD